MRSSFIVLVPLVILSGCSGDQGGTISASGHVEVTDVRVAAKVGGRLASLMVQEGDSVAAGQVVAQIDTLDIINELARARAELVGADAQLRLVEAGTRREDLARAAEELARAEAELRAAGRDLARMEELAGSGAATVKARDDAATRHDMAERSVGALRAARDRLVAGARSEEIDIARARRDAARAVVQTMIQRMSDATVRSPLDGVVTTRGAEPGEILPPGALLCVVSDLAHPWLVVYLDEPSLGRVHLGDSVAVRVDGVPGTFTGRLHHVASVAEFTPKNVQTPDERAKLVFKAKVSLDHPRGLFKPGMPADAEFTARSVNDRDR